MLKTPTYIVAMSPEQEASPQPTAFALVRVTEHIQKAIDAAHLELSRGHVGEVEIPIELPILSARTERAMGRSKVPHAPALHAAIEMMRTFGAAESVPLGDRATQAFTHFTKRASPVLLVVGHSRPPRIRTGVRGGRARYVSAPINALSRAGWMYESAPAAYRSGAV